MKKFSFGQILSISQDKLMCDIGGVYEILNYMTNDNLMTHQLPRACKECRPWILHQLPFLKEIDLAHVNRENWQSVLLELQDKYGKEFDVQPIPRDDHDYKNPIDDALINMEAIIVKLQAENNELKELVDTVLISCNPPDSCNDTKVLKTYMKACHDQATKLKEK